MSWTGPCSCACTGVEKSASAIDEVINQARKGPDADNFLNLFTA